MLNIGFGIDIVKNLKFKFRNQVWQSNHIHYCELKKFTKQKNPLSNFLKKICKISFCNQYKPISVLNPKLQLCCPCKSNV